MSDESSDYKRSDDSSDPESMSNSNTPADYDFHSQKIIWENT